MHFLKDKVAIVTGAGRGIGRTEALTLAAAGAAVVVNDRGGDWAGDGRDSAPAQQVADEIVAAGGRAVADFGDVADFSDGRAMIQRAIDTFGGLDILVCNAGFVRDRTVFKMSEEEWDSVIRVHLKGHFVPTRFATEYWREKSKTDGGPVEASIVYTSSEAGVYGHAGQANYSAAKAGIAAFGVVVAREMERYGVNVNSICPRARTRMTENTFGAVGDGDGFDSWAPENIAPFVTYLASAEAQKITGHTFVVGGGTIQLLDAITPAATLEKDSRWSIEELRSSVDTLFANRNQGLDPFPDFGLE